MHGTHEAPVVALSVLIAICASYTALTLAGRVHAARGRSRAAWLLGGSVAMGSGIWSMHFVAMLAFHLPVAISYNVPLVTLSWLVAIGASAFALLMACRPTLRAAGRMAAGVCLGLAVVAMHYIGMAAVRVEAVLTYDRALVAASVIVAITASTVALYLFMRLRNDTTRRGRVYRAGAAVVMGLAIAGMHYTAMAAAHFTVADHAIPPDALSIGSRGLAVPVVMGAFLILALAVAGSITDHWLRDKLDAAEALRESEERYRSVVTDIDEVIFRMEGNHLSFLNPAWTTITGFAPQSSLGRPLAEYVHPEDRDGMVEQCRLLIEGETDFYRQEVRALTRDGGCRWIEVHARVARDTHGAPVGTAGVMRDVTERRQAEEALRRAGEAAEAASRAKSEFLSRMSHELRTPLNAILGFGQLMELDATTPAQHESADHVLKAGRHLLSLINEILDITGIESGRLTLSAEPVRVGEVVQEVFDLIGPLAAARRIELVVDASVRDHYVRADRQRLKQVLLNLAANAVKYNRDGGRAIVSCEPAGAVMRIGVTDTGSGIDPAKMGRLFTPFDRLGAEQTGVEGTGLGLALSKRLAEAMNGRIIVSSAPGKGSTFSVELPRDEGQLARLERLDPNVSGAQDASPAARAATRILYVEDNLSNLTLVQRVLARRADVELIPCMQGGLALELARLHQPDLVLLDLHLPDIPGEVVLGQLRQAPDCRAIPVVVLSADATQGQIDRLLAAGAHAYVTKPLDVKPFLAAVDEALALRAAA